MKTIRFSLILTFGLFSGILCAQQDLFNENPILSPEIHENHSVTFRIKAPDAEQVSVTGSLDAENAFATATYDMVKGTDSVWTYTTPVLPSEMYRYHFTVDGVRTVDPANAHAIRDVGNLSNVFLIDGGLADYYQVNPVPHGDVSFRWYTSPGNDKMRRLTVYTPPGYFGGSGVYPVLYLLHGIGGDEEAWLGSGRAAQIMDNLIARGEAEPMIVVMTNGNVSQEAAPGSGSAGFVRPTFMLPNTMDGKFEETFVDVINYIEAHYRTPKTKESRAIAGLSMGGFHTANISLNYPDTFDYVGLFSSALGVQRPGAGTPPEIYRDQDEKLSRQMENGYELYWMAIGDADMEMILRGNEAFRNKMDEIGMEYTYVGTDGGHTWNNWRKYLVEFAPLLFR